MMKKKLALTTALLAAGAITLAGCASGGDAPGDGAGALDGKGKTLNVLTDANTLYPEEQQKWFADVSEKFKAKTGAEVKFETFASANDELTKIQTSVVSGQGPDIYSLGTTFTPTAYATGAFVKVSDDDWKKVGGRDRFTEASLGISGPDKDNEVGIPARSRPFVMAYNTEMLAAAGIDKPADTWDGLLEQAKKLTHDDVYGLSIAYGDNFDPWKFIWAMSTQAGNPIIDGKKVRLDDPVTIKAYETYFGWLTQDKVVNPAAIGWKASQALASFADGKAAFMPMVTATSINTLEASAVAGKYAYAVMPTVPPGETKRPSDGKEAASILSGSNFVVADYSKNKDLSFALIEMLTTAEEQKVYYDTFGEMPTNAKAAEALETDNAQLAPIVEASKLSVGTPFSGAWGDVQLGMTNVVVQAIPSLNAGSVSTDQIISALKTEQDKAQSALDRAK
ncbi:ABC transporter substrate-binding protein [Mycetocola saprophilus]|uniref:ABC transporter substrate-binding protein n=1 Tax=Mycetocola saprophilus TaxID=76636 RepID=UPI0004C16B5A|nr:extracellular solute-binding protein [Mycetocola saprophilus]